MTAYGKVSINPGRLQWNQKHDFIFE